MRRLSILVVACVCAHSVAVVTPQATADSPSFTVRSYRGGPSAEDFLKQCQSKRDQLHEKWFGEKPTEAWRPCCEIVLHASRPSYIQAVGRGGSQTYGSSLIKSDGGKIVRRRIDLLVNQHQQFTALTHELTHVVIADRFEDGQPPLWADEGIATLADSATKQSLHHADCLTALRGGTSFRLIDLLRYEQFKFPHHMPAFYGQSLSLVQFLIEQDKPSKLIPFLETADEHGYDRALREVYGIDGVSRLEVLWREYAISGSKSRNEKSPPVAAGG